MEPAGPYNGEMGYREPVALEAAQFQILALRRMTEGAKLSAALAASERSREMLRQALRAVMPGASEAELHARFLERMALCHKRTS